MRDINILPQYLSDFNRVLYFFVDSVAANSHGVNGNNMKVNVYELK